MALRRSRVRIPLGPLFILNTLRRSALYRGLRTVRIPLGPFLFLKHIEKVDPYRAGSTEKAPAKVLFDFEIPFLD